MFLCVWGSPAAAVAAALAYALTFRDSEDFLTIEDLLDRGKRGTKR